jgi:carbamoyl-phosphate synthase small subunit
MATVRALLALEDGLVFQGQSFGATGTTAGEVCFNTSLTGYQEILTDPSYRGQIIAMTYPEIGNYGVNPLDVESPVPQVAGFVVRQVSPVASNWRSRQSLPDYLRENGIIGIQGLDTRLLTKHLRVKGALRGVITTEALSEKEAIAQANAFTYVGRDFVLEASTREKYLWDPESKLSRQWSLIQGSREPGRPPLTGEDYLLPLPAIRYKIAAYDFGIKFNILRRLRQHGFQITVYPAQTPAEDLLADNPDGIFLSNGPGDPAALTYAHDNVKKLIGKKPLFGICLGHQILGHAVGGDTLKLKFGHRGGNQPVQEVKTGKVYITSQNHGFAVNPESLPPEVKVTQRNLNDQTCEGLAHTELPVFSVQYHPEASPGPHDATYFFEEFASMIESNHSPA